MGTRTVLGAGLALAVLVGGCAVQPPAASTAGPGSTATAPTIVQAAPSPLAIPTTVAAPTTPPASPASATTSAPPASPTSTTTTSTSAAPKPTTTTTSTSTSKPTASSTSTAAIPVESLPGYGTTVRYKSSGKAVSSVQTALKNLGYYSGSINGYANAGTVNAIVNFQRAQGIEDSGIAASQTWAALAAPHAVPTGLPGSCYGSGVVLCVSKAQRKLFWLRNGAVVKTIKVRVGGFTDAKDGTMRVHQTVEGTYSVYKKDPNPTSLRYGENAMPYSVMFDPNMYVHYSQGFHDIGYLGASHGCVNVGDLSTAKWIFNNTPVGARVIVF